MHTVQHVQEEGQRKEKGGREEEERKKQTVRREIKEMDNTNT